MSTGPELSGDLIAVACVADASLHLALEWPRVLMEYVYPLLKRLNELHPSHQFRLAFVAYGAADTRPQPLLSKRFFAPLSQISKELREEPSKLGIGHTNSGGGRGLSALEGLVAAIELFDILMMSSNFAGNHVPTQSQKESRSLIFHILHIAASPPDNAQRPQYNTLHHLDSVNWDSIPIELKKRKINLSLISLRNIPQFQDLQTSIAGSGAQSPWFTVRAPHVLLLAGFPAPQKTDQSPDPKRQKVVADPISKTSSASPALPSARIPQNIRSQQPISLQAQPPQPTTPSGQHLSPAQPVQGATSVPAPTSTTVTPLPPSGPTMPVINAEVLEQVVTPTTFKFGQLMERLKALEREIATIESQISNAQNTGQVAVVAMLQKDLAQKAHFKDQIKMLLKQHYQKMLHVKEASDTQVGAAGSALSGSAEAGPSTQSHLPNIPSISNERPPMGTTTEEHKPALLDSQILTQFWQSRGGMISVPNSSDSQTGLNKKQSHPTMSPEVASQTQKPIEKKGIQPPSFAPSSAIMSHETPNSNTTNIQLSRAPAWHVTFSWTSPAKLSGQAGNEIQIHVSGFSFTSGIVHTDTWPKILTLNPCKEPLKDTMELPSWLARHKSRTHLIHFRSNPGAPDGHVNEQKFHALHKFMTDHRIYVYAGWRLPSGKFSYNIIIFPRGTLFGGAMFPDGLPDLPGSGNTLDAQPSAEEAKPPPSSGLSGLNLPPALVARMQGLEPAKQKQLITSLLLMRQQEQMRRQQLQQTQQSNVTTNQNLNSLGTIIPSNPYSTAVNMPAGLHANVNASGSTSSGVSNAGGGTVNYEMLQSFMQRNAEGSTFQGMNPG